MGNMKKNCDKINLKLYISPFSKKIKRYSATFFCGNSPPNTAIIIPCKYEYSQEGICLIFGRSFGNLEKMLNDPFPKAHFREILRKFGHNMKNDPSQGIHLFV